MPAREREGATGIGGGAAGTGTVDGGLTGIAFDVLCVGLTGLPAIATRVVRTSVGDPAMPPPGNGMNTSVTAPCRIAAGLSAAVNQGPKWVTPVPRTLTRWDSLFR